MHGVGEPAYHKKPWWESLISCKHLTHDAPPTFSYGAASSNHEWCQGQLRALLYPGTCFQLFLHHCYKELGLERMQVPSGAPSLLCKEPSEAGLGVCPRQPAGLWRRGGPAFLGIEDQLGRYLTLQTGQ